MRDGNSGVAATLDRVTLAGDESALEIIWGGKPVRSDTPVICASVVGYSSLTSVLRGSQDKAEVERLSDWLRDTHEGPFVSLVDAAATRRPIGLIQADTSDSESQNYYEANRPRPDRGIWKDFYFESVFAAVREADRRWSPDEIELTHPTGGAWTRDLLAVSLEALGHLADHHDLSCQSIRLGCIHGVDENDFAWAMTRLNQEQSSQSSGVFSDFKVESVDSSSPGIPVVTSGAIVKIEVASTARASDPGSRR